MYQETVTYFTNLIVYALQYLSDNLTHNHGWSILLLTLSFRIIILPLTMKSLKSMKAMQQLQPRIKELQAKYADDKERQSREMMGLYKQAGVNPFSGCLPMLLQIPIFILLFRALRYPELNGYILINTSFYGMDLTSAVITKLPHTLFGGMTLAMPGMLDLSFTNIGFLHNTFLYLPSIYLVVLMVVSTFLQQASMTMDPQQKPMMYMMNIFIVYISLMMPTGVMLYWVFSNMFQLVQQKFTNSGLKPAEVAASAGKGDAAPKAAKAVKSPGKNGGFIDNMKTMAKEASALEAEKKKPSSSAPKKQTGSIKKQSHPKKTQSKGKNKKRK